MNKIFLSASAFLSAFLRRSLFIVPVAAITGSVVALFLVLLDRATALRWGHPWFLYFLPLAGVVIHFLYRSAGKNAEAGNNLIIDEIHAPGGGVPPRMAPLVLGTTIITHLFGGSAGREGTAVQIGGSISQWLAKRFGLTPPETARLLTTGVAAGFGAVFGTPVAGAVFALEVLALGRIRTQGFLPCLVASVLADLVCRAWGIQHTHYKITTPVAAFGLPPLQVLLAAGLLGLAAGLVARAFAFLSHGIKAVGTRSVRPAWLLPAAGGVVVIAGCFLLGTQDYLGLGVDNPAPGGVSIRSAFHGGGAMPLSWCWKLLFTAVTLGTGFKGGEVTPLFFIGATLGNTLAATLGAPVDLMAGIGFIAVFSGATNTPVASILMGMELFGGGHVFSFAIACFAAYYVSGQTGIYRAQRIAGGKLPAGVRKIWRRTG